MRIGAKLANFGPDAIALADAAAGLEAAGVDSLWLSDRVVTLDPIGSNYPFSADGSVPWTDQTPFLDVLIAMAVAAAHTSQVEVGAGVLVLPLRNPVLLAKQVASLDVLAGGRVLLGVGSGWMAEEFDLLGVPFAERARRTDEAIEVIRACWQGDVPPVERGHQPIPAGVSCYPVPLRPVPLLAGGMSPAALRRASRLDGWFGYVTVADLDPTAIAAALRTVRAGVRSEGQRRDVLRVVGPPQATADALPALIRAGLSEVVTDLDWRNPNRAAADVAMLRMVAANTELAAAP